YKNLKDSMKELLNKSPLLECLGDFSFNLEFLLEAQKNIALRELYTCKGLASILPVLEEMYSIREVSFSTMEEWTLAPTQESLSLSQHSVKPFNWSYLLCAQRFPLGSLFHRLPFLTFLHIVPTIHELKEITMALHQLQSLRICMIYLTAVPGHSPSLTRQISPVKPNHSIRRLVFHTMDFGFVSTIPQEERLLISVILFEMLCQAAPSVEHLGIGGDNPLLSHLKLDVFEKLETLTLMPIGKEINIHIPNSVRTLLISKNSAVRKPLPSPNIKALDIQISSVKQTGEEIYNAQTTFMDLREWPALEVATLHSNYSRLTGTSFSSLRSITLKALRYRKRFDINMTLFVKEIAEAVDNYPCLEEIHMDECPEWDILMIMLERRNILAGPGIKPIKRLILPSTCPYSISQLLPGLLAGKWVTRPSNFELSQAGNANYVLNSEIPGCFACLRMLRNCDTRSWTYVRPLYNDDRLFSRLHDYPSSEDEILATWLERALLWEKFYTRGNRVLRCTITEALRLTKSLDANSSPLLSPLPSQ
ncbi:5142_t:CDS:2, partial [Acaulospora colombiana]